MNKKVLLFLLVLALLCCCLVVGGGLGYYFYNQNKVYQNGPGTILGPYTPDNTTPVASPTTTNKPANQIKQITSLTDTFDSDLGYWNLGSRESENAVVSETLTGGKLNLDITAKKSVVVNDTIFSQALYNFDLSVDGSKLSGPQDTDYGLVFRRLNSENYYLLTVSPDYQEYVFAVKKDNQWTDIVKWKKSMYVKTTGTNTVRVIAKDDKFTIYINGKLVDTITDSSLNDGGEVGVVAELYHADDKGSFEFDNFKLVLP